MEIHKKRLKNGLRIITVPMKDSPTVTVLVMVETGSEYETKKENGLSHFLEHMCFKGTKKRSKSTDISRELDSIGAESNAYTSNEYTGYYAKAHPKHTEKLIDVISDMYLNPTFPKADLEKEKGVIIEEMNMYEDLPQQKVQNVFSALVYGDQPAGWTVLGERNIIREATQDDFIRYRKKHYVASATTVIVAGDIHPKKILSLVTRAFASVGTDRKDKKLPVRTIRQSGSLIKIEQKKTDQMHLVLGVRTFPVLDKRNSTLAVLNAILGEGMSSRLFEKLRDEMGVCYYAYSYANHFTDHGDFVVAAGVDPKRVADSVSAVLDELDKLKKELVPAEELAKAKECLVSHLIMALESSDSVARFVGSQELMKKHIETPKEIERKVRKVSASDVRKLAQTIFKNDQLNLAIIGNVKNRKHLQSILKI